MWACFQPARWRCTIRRRPWTVRRALPWDMRTSGVEWALKYIPPGGSPPSARLAATNLLAGYNWRQRRWVGAVGANIDPAASAMQLAMVSLAQVQGRSSRTRRRVRRLCRMSRAHVDGTVGDLHDGAVGQRRGAGPASSGWMRWLRRHPSGGGQPAQGCRAGDGQVVGDGCSVGGDQVGDDDAAGGCGAREFAVDTVRTDCEASGDWLSGAGLRES